MLATDFHHLAGQRGSIHLIPGSELLPHWRGNNLVIALVHLKPTGAVTAVTIPRRSCLSLTSPSFTHPGRSGSSISCVAMGPGLAPEPSQYCRQEVYQVAGSTYLRRHCEASSSRGQSICRGAMKTRRPIHLPHITAGGSEDGVGLFKDFNSTQLIRTSCHSEAPKQGASHEEHHGAEHSHGRQYSLCCGVDCLCYKCGCIGRECRGLLRDRRLKTQGAVSPLGKWRHARKQ